MTSTPSTPEDLAADLAACEAATAGPWRSCPPISQSPRAYVIEERGTETSIGVFYGGWDAACAVHCRNRFEQVVRELIEERERRAETVAMCEQLRLENERWRANEAEREANRCAVTGTCHHCKTSIFRSQGLAIDGDGKEYHWTCIVTKRAELAEAEVERLRAMLKRWVSEPWGKREPSIREIIDMLRRLESDAPEWFRPQISNVLKMIIDGVAGE